MKSRLSAIKPSEYGPDHRAWHAFGLWLNVLIVGIGVLATGVAHLLERATAPIPTLAWLIGGGALVVFAWRRARALLRRLDQAEATADRAPSSNNRRARRHPASTASEVRYGMSVAATTLE